MSNAQDQAAKTLYEHMLSAHRDQFGAPSVKMRHYLQGLSAELVDRMRIVRELASESEEGQLTATPVEEQWDTERRQRAGKRTADGKPWPVRGWREVQMLRTSWLPTEKGWR